MYPGVSKFCNNEDKSADVDLDMLASVATLLLAVSGCVTDEDCSLNGLCTSSTCVCDSGWRGDDCGLVHLAPVVLGSGYNLTGDERPTSSWGANIFPDEDLAQNPNTWHMYASEFTEHCDIRHWSPNSRIVHTVSTSGPLGPYSFANEVVPAFAHNPKVLKAPDGTWLMYTIGVKVPKQSLFNCSKHLYKGTPGRHLSEGTPVVRKNKRRQKKNIKKRKGPGRTPGNRESNITLYTAPSLTGPWTSQGVVLGENDQGTWDEDTSNPSPWILPSGEVLLMYRGCVVGGGGCHNEYIGVASAPSWRGPYTRLLKTPILPGTPAEDPSFWVDKRGHFHFLMHYIPDKVKVARHAFARNYTGPWSLHKTSIPYTTLVALDGGGSIEFHKRERPHFVFAADGTTPTHMITGVVTPGPWRGYSGPSYTLVQAVLP